MQHETTTQAPDTQTDRPYPRRTRHPVLPTLGGRLDSTRPVIILRPAYNSIVFVAQISRTGTEPLGSLYFRSVRCKAAALLRVLQSLSPDNASVRACSYATPLRHSATPPLHAHCTSFQHSAPIRILLNAKSSRRRHSRRHSQPSRAGRGMSRCAYRCRLDAVQIICRSKPRRAATVIHLEGTVGWPLAAEMQTSGVPSLSSIAVLIAPIRNSLVSRAHYYLQGVA